MSKSIRRIVWCVALSAVFGLILPAIAMGAAPGSRRGSVGRGRSYTFHSRRVVSQRPARRRGPSGPLSYNAYWKAATSPSPPRTNQDYNRYWQKMQAWQEYHQRQN